MPERTCSIDGCGRHLRGGAKGLCSGHYRRLKITGSPQADVPLSSPFAKGAACTLPGCDRPLYDKRGWCKLHWKRWYTKGDVFAEIPLQPGKALGGPDLATRFWAKVDKSGECWLWTRKVDGKGYGRYAEKVSGVPRYRFAHRIAWELTNGPIPPDLLVCHRCDTPPCVRPDHLFLGTIADNNADRDAKGRGNRGSKNGGAKLAEDDVRAIRAAYAGGGVLQRDLAARYGVGQPVIARIIAGHSWRHVE